MPQAAERQGLLLAVEAVPEVHMRRKSRQLVTLDAAQEVPAHSRGHRGKLGKHLLGVVLTDVGEASFERSPHGFGPEALGYGHHRDGTRPAPSVLYAITDGR